MDIRRALPADLPAVAAIYGRSRVGAPVARLQKVLG
jgi:hypothetical protein